MSASEWMAEKAITSFWQWLRRVVKFWWTARKRVEALEDAKDKPRTWDQQFCPICKQKGIKVTKIKPWARDGMRHCCNFQCPSCDDTWLVFVD